MRDRRVIGLVVAAGAGERAGGGVPKQYRRVAGRAVIARACDGLAAHPAIDAVHVVIGAGQEALLAEAFGGNPPAWTIGGATRRDSVRAGLAAIDGTIVLIHDAARPFLPAAVVDRLLAALDDADGAVPALPVADTLARGDAALGDTVARAGLNRIQTPQAFPLPLIRAAHAAWPEGEEATDDAQVARAAGHGVALVAGDAALDKLTTADDIARAEARLAARLVSRTGSGFDVHRLEAGAELWLGGVRIAHDKGLSGHSDADVALHALTDAILGAIGDGDIGSHFPPSDPQWRGAPSRLFVEHAAALVAARGGVIDHVDVTIICEAPRVGPYRDSIRATIAALLRLPERRVSIKATTTERLGFTGRGEGIAAQAIATVRLSEDQ
ncbi:bifunctional 2-C-methyl-D-erythritol 4-phosphate cytidylyltransferase/2-C-methyl-D-erythritol 2,4-cyclodiphosphate synthase [Sphingomonas flavalba]|uniref:bifunctional 2-C-methyl-D-erythritol 4-phosphate cytidylyltransferase/2-C-methyl-D-erythritol 2,4-cyclodiphosphate synthase n=1 Tax=Sphingomonas flavalba TaxID=2559804 RepID=UPI0039E1DA55